MKQVQSKLWVKITALLLLSICSVVLLFSALGIAYLADQGGYVNPEGFVKDHIASNAFFSDMTAAADYYTAYLQKQSGDSYTSLENFEQKFSRENSNFFFTVQDDTGKTVFEKDSGLNVSGEAAGETRIPDLLPESRDRDHHHHHSNK